MKKMFLLVLLGISVISLFSQTIQLTTTKNDEWIDIIVHSNTYFFGINEIEVLPGDTTRYIYVISDTTKTWWIQGGQVFSLNLLRVSQYLGTSTGSYIYGGYVVNSWIYPNTINTITPFEGGIGTLWQPASPYPLPAGLIFDFYNPSDTDTAYVYVNLQLRVASNAALDALGR